MLPIALLLLQTAMAGSLKELDKRNGFRDLALGTTCSKVSGFAREGIPDRKLLSYVRPSDVLQVGEAQIQSITYSCYLDQLAQIRVVVLGESNQANMLDALVEAYGAPTESQQEDSVQIWSSKKVLLETFRAPSSDTLVIAITSQPLLQQRLKDVIDAKAAAIEDL